MSKIILKENLLVRTTVLTVILFLLMICTSIPVFAASSSIVEVKPKPDLRPKNISYVGTPMAGKLACFDLLVQNAGTANSGSFYVKWSVNGVEVSRSSHLGIVAGKSRLDDNASLLYVFPKAGTYTVSVEVDCNRQITESNEINNFSETKVIVVSPSTDLEPTAITASATTNIKKGQRITFDSGVKNNGAVDSGAFAVKWLVNNIQSGYGSHANVPANTTVMNGNSQFEYTFNSTGTYTITYQVDADNAVGESNENNNQVSILITVNPTELSPTGITASATTNIKVGQPITFDCGIKNNGGVDASNFYADWYVNGTHVARNGYAAVPAYSTVYDEKNKLNYTFSAPGTYTITFKIDPDNKLGESNINNNMASFTITILPPDLVPTMITTSQVQYIKVGQRVTFLCGIRNDGGAPTSAFNVNWFVDGQLVSAYSHLGIPARTSTNNDCGFDYTFYTPGNHTVLFKVDSTDLIYEYNEIDNETTAIVNVTQ